MLLTIRPATVEGSPEFAAGLLGTLIAHPGAYGVVAEDGGRIVGSNFVDERGPIFGIGPITVDPATQNSGVGRRLMQDALDRAAAAGAPGVRLLQDCYHNRSFGLYASLGFEVRDTTAVLQGPAPTFARCRVQRCGRRRAPTPTRVRPSACRCMAPPYR